MSDPLEHKVSITQDIPLSQGRTAFGTDLTRFVFDQTGVGSGSHHGPSPMSCTKKKNGLPAMAWRRGVVTMVVVVVVLAPKWNEQRKNEQGVVGARENSTDGFHLPDRRREDRKTVVAAAVDP